MKKSTLTRTLLILLAAVTLAGIALWTLKPPEVQAVRPARGPAVEAVYATGTVEAATTVRLAARTAGRLLELKADEGQEVAAGQLLARLEDRDARATVAELEARAAYARQRLQRTRDLRDKGFISKDQLQQAQTDLQAASAALDRAREQQDFLAIRAPAAGRIIRRDGEIGDFIPVNQTLFYLSAADSALRIEADIDEEDIARVRLQQRALVSAGAFPGKVVEGRVTQITPKGDPVARAYRVRIGLPADAPLMIGMTTDVNIVYRERANALLVPTSALADNAVWVVRNGAAKRQPVTVGARGATRSEIVSGLAEDELVIVRPDNLQDGRRVRVAPQGSAPAR